MWRPDPAQTATYQLICENTVNAVSGLNAVPQTGDITDAEQCTFLQNDVIGWSQDGAGVISYTDLQNTCPTPSDCPDSQLYWR